MTSSFIKRLPISIDIAMVLADLNNILNRISGWEPYNQIGLRHRPGCLDQWKDSIGGLYHPDTKERTAFEKDFSEWNDGCPEYTKHILEDLATSEGIKWGRVRFMMAKPKTGLSMHFDDEYRYHLVLKTNPGAIFGECFKNNQIRSICYHIPVDSYWYRIDTTKEHFVYNGGWEPRIHLVCCPVN